MNNFYNNTTAQDSSLTMIGITKKSVESRLSQHNKKGSMGWVNNKQYSFSDPKGVEDSFKSRFKSLVKEGETEIYYMSSTQADYGILSCAGRGSEYAISPFAKDIFDSLKDAGRDDSRVMMIPTTSLRTFQVRSEVVNSTNLAEVQEAIEIDGFIKKPLIVHVRESKSEVISGNHRFHAALNLEMSTVPVIFVSEAYLQEKDITDLGVLLNSTHEVGMKTGKSDIRDRLILDIRSVGYEKVEENYLDYAQMFNVSKRSINNYIKGAKKAVSEKVAEESGIFSKPDSSELSRIVQDKILELGMPVYPVDSKNIYGQLGSSLLSCICEDVKEFHVLLHFTSLSDFNYLTSREGMLLNRIENINSKTSIKVTYSVVDHKTSRYS